MESSVFYWQNLFVFCLFVLYDTQHEQRLFPQNSKPITFVTKKQSVFCETRSNYTNMNFIFYTTHNRPKSAINTSTLLYVIGA